MKITGPDPKMIELLSKVVKQNEMILKMNAMIAAGVVKPPIFIQGDYQGVINVQEQRQRKEG